MHGRSRNSGLNTAIGRLHRLRSWYLNKTLSLPFRASFGWRLLFIGAPYYGIEILVRHEPILEVLPRHFRTSMDRVVDCRCAARQLGGKIHRERFQPKQSPALGDPIAGPRSQLPTGLTPLPHPHPLNHLQFPLRLTPPPPPAPMLG